MKHGFTCGTFDLLHAGHVCMLRWAREQCDWLVVGLQADPTLDRPHKNKPVQTLWERYTQLSAVRWVDEVVPYTREGELLDLLRTTVPHVRVLGSEYRLQDFTGRELCEQLGIQLLYNPRQHNHSTTPTSCSTTPGLKPKQRPPTSSLKFRLVLNIPSML